MSPSSQDYFISLYSEQRQITETLLSLFIRCSVPGEVLIVSIPDICLLPYFLYSHEYRLTRNTVYCAILSDQIVVGCPLGVPISYYIDWLFCRRLLDIITGSSAEEYFI